MRLAVYFNWLDLHHAWSPGESGEVGFALMEFFENYVIPVLRARVPAGHNQQLSMTLCTAVVAEVFGSTTGGVGERARALSAYAMPKLRQTLGLMPSSGYSGEGRIARSMALPQALPYC